MEQMGACETAREGDKKAVVTDGLIQRTNDFGGVRGGVIQSTRRRRHVSQESNLLTLAQKAVELASLQNVKVGDVAPLLLHVLPLLTKDVWCRGGRTALSLSI